MIGDVDEARVEQAIEAIRGELTAQVARGRLPGGPGPLPRRGSSAGCTGVQPLRGLRPRARGHLRGGDGSEAAGGSGSLEDIIRPRLPPPHQHLVALVDKEKAGGSGIRAGSAGMHLNPITVIPLVELVRTPATDDVTLRTAWSPRAGRQAPGPPASAMRPAFVVNRLLTRDVLRGP